MKKITNKLGAFWLLSFGIVTTLFIISVVIYGFDIKTNGSRKALTSQIKNEGQTNYYYKIDDQFAFGVFSDREPGDFDVHLTVYDENYIPFCYFCGYYTGDMEDDRGFNQPYAQGDLIYNIDINDKSRDGNPDDTYSTYNLKTSEYGYINSLTEISADASDPKHRLTREYISAQFDELSYSSSDDEDCIIAFGAVTLSYIILILWGILAVLFRKSKTN